ncbi:MAG: class I SAM-dependent methyltransferase [Sphingomonadales bacterium]|nr:class I SAM-dependent methyltransferase [Sphingomonadales bacterium]
MFISKIAKVFIIFGFVVFLHGCSDNSNNSQDPIVNAVADPDRLAVDLARDENRKPVEILKFFGVKPGMNVIDVFSGGGYYTQILDNIVGSDGAVIAHNNQGYKDFAKSELEDRYGAGRLENTVQYWAEANELSFEPESADLVVIILGVHDVYYKPQDQSWPTIEEDKFYNAIIGAIKEGGVLGIIDHRAEAGAPETTGHMIHRIDPAIIIRELSKRGMVLEAESDILANPDDTLQTPMWDPEIKGRTDRFVLRFRKPEAADEAANEAAASDMDTTAENTPLNTSWRTDADKARDELRKPQEVLSFFDVGEGMSVLDLRSGSGYYSRVLSGVVGVEGTVVAHNAPRASAERRATLTESYSKLDNVNYIISPLTELPLEDNSVDRVLLFLMYHHLHYSADSGEVLPQASAAVLAEVRRVLKPNGVFGLIEHKAPDGTNRGDSAALHRVTGEIAIADMESNGFTLVKSSDLFSHFTDPMDCNWQSCVERGHTNRIVHYYQAND